MRDFQLRRIKWAVQELKSQGEIPKLWKVLRKVGIKEGILPRDGELYN